MKTVMKIDVMSNPRELHAIQTQARDIEQAGFSGITFTEGGRTAYLSVAAAALATEKLEFSTGIAVAFPRSPMVTAANAWELQEASRGRFRLGLGTQVRAHITRRYGVEFDPPGPRMRDYIGALKAIFKAYQGEAKLDYQGPYYQLTLLNKMWSPGRIDYPAPAIDAAAVNPYMLKMAGELCDGIQVHPFHSQKYISDMLRPAVAEGAARVERDPSEVELLIPVLTVVGNTEEEKAASRAFCRQQVAFYGSTPNYAFQFDLLGYEGTTAKIRECQKAGDMDGMSDVITDEILQHYITEASWDDLADKLIERYEGIAERLIIYTAGMDYARDPSSIGPWGEVARAVVGKS
jgi:probable F420-dependent oxidoreductase